MQHSARCMESISVIAIRYGTVARENGTWIRESRSRTYLSMFYMSFEFSSVSLPPLSLSHSLSLSLSLSLFFLSFCFFSFSVLREISHQGEQTVDLSRSFFRILDSPGHRATKNGCLSIRGPRNVRPRVTLASWKRKIKWNSLFVHEITSPVKYLFLSGPGETW